MIKRLKYADMAGQAGVALFTMMDAMAGITDLIAGNFLWIYFLTGGWQMLSFFIHLFAADQLWYNNKSRVTYAKTLIWTFIAGMAALLLGSVTDSGLALFYLFAMLVITPFYACWYFYIGITEINIIRQKELIHLK